MINNISETLERFYISTNLPIAAFTIDGKSMDFSGYDDRFKEMLYENKIWDEVLKRLEDLKKFKKIIIPNINNINYTACLVDPNNFESGIYILGPHSCMKNNDINIPYKPKCLMGNLISLLYIIDKDISKGRYFKATYGFHVNKALKYISQRYSDDITLTDISDFLNINKSYFSTLLKKQTGKTFTQILNEIRIEESKKLLIETDDSILEIALAVGFNNQNYYNITFKKITGMTPLELKNTRK